VAGETKVEQPPAPTTEPTKAAAKAEASKGAMAKKVEPKVKSRKAAKEAAKAEASEGAMAKKVEPKVKSKKAAKEAAKAEAKSKQPTPSATRNSETATQFQAPPLPISADKQARLKDLTEKYKADQITPAQYHEQRAKILAGP
jgi:archaellum component FlaD/FlaE